MFQDWKAVMVMSIVYSAMFCAALALAISFFQISDAYVSVVIAKILSLALLAAFGQSEALKFYTDLNSGKDVHLERAINSLGILSAIAVMLFLFFKVCMRNAAFRESVLTNPKLGGLRVVWDYLYSLGDMIAFIPILLFSLVNLVMWWRRPATAQMGRICFVAADLPVLAPMAIVFLLMIAFGRGESLEGQLTLGGATVMFILVSTFLNECAKSLLHSELGPRVPASHSADEEMSANEPKNGSPIAT